MPATQAQTHCPGCGQHRQACNTVILGDNGAWKCQPCVRRDELQHRTTVRGEQEKLQREQVTIRCPKCQGSGFSDKILMENELNAVNLETGPCETCGGYGTVLAPKAKLRVFDPMSKGPGKTGLRSLTEDGQR